MKLFILYINLFQTKKIKYYDEQKEMLSKLATIEDKTSHQIKTTHMIGYSKLRYDMDRIKKTFACWTI